MGDEVDMMRAVLNRCRNAEEAAAKLRDELEEAIEQAKDAERCARAADDRVRGLEATIDRQAAELADTGAELRDARAWAAGLERAADDLVALVIAALRLDRVDRVDEAAARLEVADKLRQLSEPS